MPLRDVKLYPEIVSQVIEPNSTRLTIKLKNRGCGIGRVEVRVNGREFSSDVTTGVIANRNVAKATIPVEIPKDALNAGANKVEVIVWNKEGDVRSRSKEFGFVVEANGAVRGTRTFQLDGEKQTYNGHFYAIVAEFPNTPIPLSICALPPRTRKICQKLSRSARKREF